MNGPAAARTVICASIGWVGRARSWPTTLAVCGVSRGSGRYAIDDDDGGEDEDEDDDDDDDSDNRRSTTMSGLSPAPAECRK